MYLNNAGPVQKDALYGRAEMRGEVDDDVHAEGVDLARG
jgi:hypothetical protein